VADTAAPTVSRLRVEPAAAGVSAGGSTGPLTIRLPATEAVVVTGPVHLWVEAEDRADGGGHRLAPYRVETVFDGRPVSTLTLGRFDWNWPAEVEWVFHEPSARVARERWLRLFGPGGSRQPLYHTPTAPEWSPGVHTLEIVVSDHAGNRTRREIRFVVASGGSEPARAGSPEPGVRSRGSFLECAWSPATGDVPVITGANGSRAPWDWTQTTGSWGTAAVNRAPHPGLWRVRAGSDTAPGPGSAIFVDPEGSAPLAGTLEGFGWEIEPGCVYEPLWIGVEAAPPPDLGTEPELDPVSGMVRLTPWAEPLRSRMTVSLELPPGVARDGVGIYSRQRGGWSYEGAGGEGTTLRTRIANLEDLALLRDPVPPLVVVLSPPEAGATPAHPLEARILDSGSGIVWSNLSMRLDDVELIAEWDPDHDVLRAHPARPPGPGEHRLVVTARDRAGNLAQTERRFTIQ
jgi:hypothetical protein